MLVRNCLLGVLLLSIVLGCNGSKRMAQAGSAISTKAPCQYNYTPLRNLVVVPVNLQGEQRNFILDSGSPITYLHSRSGRVKKVNAPAPKASKPFRLDSLSICHQIFFDTWATRFDFKALELDIPQFGGLLGQSVLQKSAWHLDLGQHKLTLGPKKDQAKEAEALPVKQRGAEWLLPLYFDGKKHWALLDLGSNHGIAVPSSSKLAEQLQQQHALQAEEQSPYDLKKNKNALPLQGVLDTVQVGDSLLVRQVPVALSQVNRLTVGTRFFGEGQLWLFPQEKWFRFSPAKNAP